MADLAGLFLSRPSSSNSSSRLMGSRAPFHLPVTSSLPSSTTSTPSSSLIDLASSSSSSFAYSLSSKLPLSRQPSMDPSAFLLSSSSSSSSSSYSILPPFSRQTSFSTSSYPFSSFLSMDDDAVDSFAFSSSFSSDELSASSLLLKGSGDFDDFDLASRTSSYDSDLSSWTSDGGANTPLSPHSSVESVSDSSQSTEAELFAVSSSPASAYPLVGQGQWVQPSAVRLPVAGKDDFGGFPLMGALPELQRSMSTASAIPVLPQAFTQPLYAFNYHCHPSDEESTRPSPSSSSRHERREGLRGGGSGRASHPHQLDAAEQSEEEMQQRMQAVSSDSRRESLSSTSSSISSTHAHAPASPSQSTVSPKSLLLALAAARTPPTGHTSSASHSSHYSSSSASLSSSPAPELELDPNEVVIGIYTRAERAAKIARYREKRANRQWKKKIMYNCRKSFADNRPRVGGRFIKMKADDADKGKKGGK